MDTLISKPAHLRGYAVHRLVEQFMQGKRSLWKDEGKAIRIRDRDAAPPPFEAGKVIAFSVKACVAKTSGNRHRYLPTGDWRGRREWMVQRSVKCGFELIDVHVSGGMESIETHDGRKFTVDATDFIGLLRITDVPLFQNCYQNGIAKVGKAFGLNMIIID